MSNRMKTYLEQNSNKFRCKGITKKAIQIVLFFGNVKLANFSYKMMKKTSSYSSIHIVIFLIISFSIVKVQSLSWIELFGMEDLVTDLVKATPTVHYTGQQSVSYAVDDRLINFLKNFQTRTDFCNYKCPSFYQLPCFILFQCNIQIRNFILMIILPIFLVALIGLCCGRGIWTFGCWAKYIGLFTGIFFIIWFMKKFIKGYEIVQRRKREREFIKEQRQKRQIEIEPVLTEKRFTGQN